MASIRIDGDIYNDVTVSTGGYLPMVEDGSSDWYVAEDYEQADAATLTYWQDMADNDPKELVCLIGEKRIVEMWANGTTLEDFVGDIPAGEQWGSYNGSESEVEPPTAEERERASLIEKLRDGEPVEDDANCAGVEIDGVTYWLMSEGEGEQGTRFAREPGGNAIEADKSDVIDALADEEIARFVEGWDELVEELGFAPTLAFRHN